MNLFQSNQRYTSTAEPELGVGIVTEISKGRVKIHFAGSGETRLYAADTAPLRRVVFKPGDSIVDRDGRAMVVERVEDLDGLMVYFGQGKSISEADLGNVSVKHGADDRLLMGDVDAPALFALRRRTLEFDHGRRISAVNGFLGGRIDLIPHQLYIASEVSGRYAPRVLLSDEVGLGKTIEACLIVHRLRLLGRVSRVLILVPESLVHQWFVELLRRFNLWFQLFDEEHCAAVEEGAPDGNPFLDSQLIVCSTAFLAGSPRRARQAVAATWDMLVVDEAHHLEWSVEGASPAYAVVEALSQTAKGLLLLTATPEQLGLESHFARLRLLDPDRYSDFEAFREEALHDRETADIVGKLLGGEELSEGETAWLAGLVGGERVSSVKGHVNGLGFGQGFGDGGSDGKAPGKVDGVSRGRGHVAGGKTLGNEERVARDLLVQDLLDRHGPGRVVFRNRRSAMKGFPRRIAQLVPLAGEVEGGQGAAGAEGDSVAAGGEGESSLTVDGERGSLLGMQGGAQRVDWLIGLMQRLRPAKVLLICNSKEKVLALEAELSKRVKFKVGVFHEDLTLVRRDRQAAWFSEADGARLLLCSEIGSEGRNFQFAHHLVLFDLPLQPDLLEQRIGRLDRIGQTEDIQIHVPYLLGTGEEALARWYHEGLNAFESNLEGGNRMAELFGERLMPGAGLLSADRFSKDFAVAPRLGLGAGEMPDLPGTASFSKDFAVAPHLGDLELDALISETVAAHAELKATLAAGRDRLLELNSFRPEVAADLIDQIRAEDLNLGLEKYMLEVFEHFGIDVEDLAPRTYLLHLQLGNAIAFPELRDEGMGVTFDRKRALSREEMGFLSWDHPMVTGAIDMVLGEGTGSASFGILRGTGGVGILLEAVFVLETAGKAGKGVDRFLPSTPLRVVVDHTGADVTALYPVEGLDARLRAGEVDDLLENEVFVESFFPKMLASAADIAEEMAVGEVLRGLRLMEATLDREIDRLRALQKKNNHVRPAEIAIAVEERVRLGEVIRGAMVRLDAVLLIQRGV